jgi:hypothetical protein
MIVYTNRSEEWDRSTALAKQRKIDKAAELRKLKSKGKYKDGSTYVEVGIAQKLLDMKDPLIDILLFLNEKVKSNIIADEDVSYNMQKAIQQLSEVFTKLNDDFL